MPGRLIAQGGVSPVGSRVCGPVCKKGRRVEGESQGVRAVKKTVRQTVSGPNGDRGA